MVIAKHTGDFTAMVRAERKKESPAKKDKEDSKYHTWRYPSEGVAP
jgi:hypothetical protein